MKFKFGDKVRHKKLGQGVFAFYALSDTDHSQVLFSRDYSVQMVHTDELSVGWINRPIRHGSIESSSQQAVSDRKPLTDKGFKDITSLLIRLSVGLKLKDLTKSEKEVLAEEYGINWREVLGYKLKLPKKKTLKSLMKKKKRKKNEWPFTDEQRNAGVPE